MEQNHFIKKGYGRIFVDRAENIRAVLHAIREIDGYEFSYMPDGFVTVWDGKPDDLIYGHKFELDMNALTYHCWLKGIYIWCLSQRSEPLFSSSVTTEAK